MAAGLFVFRVMPTHPLAYVPAQGPSAGQRWQIGAIADFFEGDSGAPPDPGTVTPPIYRRQFYTGKTIADLLAKLPVGVAAVPENVRANLKLKNADTGNFDNDVEEWE